MPAGLGALGSPPATGTATWAALTQQATDASGPTALSMPSPSAPTRSGDALAQGLPQATLATPPQAAPPSTTNQSMTELLEELKKFLDSPQRQKDGNNQTGDQKALLALLLALIQSLGNTDPSDENAIPEALRDLLGRGTGSPASGGLGDADYGNLLSQLGGRQNDLLPAAGTGNASQYDNTFAGNQTALRDALARQGATPGETKLALGIQAVESNDGITHDANKDGRTDGSRNFSPLNLNEDMLRRHGVTGDLNQLNYPRSPQDWDKVATAFLKSRRGESEGDFIHHLRNGYEGHLNSTQAYQAGLAAQMATQERHGLGTRANVHIPYQ